MFRRPRSVLRSLGSTVSPIIAKKHISHFRVVEHTARCQNIRERPGAVKAGHENELRLAVKQYIPLDNPSPREGDVTLIGAHANAFPKELYEPLWDDIYERLARHNRRIRSIWIADVAQQGQSGVLNEKILGNDPDWTDHSRDLLYLINQYQDQIPAPLIGIGHSMGGTQLAHLSLLHPSLFTALILLDPVIQRANPGREFALASTFRRDIWPSREAAIAKFKSNPFYQAWDPRVFDNWTQYGLRELPTLLYPDPEAPSEEPVSPGPSKGGVTLTTTKAQELFYFARPSYIDERSGLPRGDPREDMHADDIDGDCYPFYRPEPANMFRRLGEVKPPVLYVFGAESPLSTPRAREEKIARTGVGIGGSGGVQRSPGNVREVVLPCGHLVPMEMVGECADACGGFIEERVEGWEERMRIREGWAGVDERERVGVGEQWMREMRGLRGKG
ncbi:toxin biosynthesis protein [Aspergillus egyptiacus]|nr:toxin biosynthesis protein [Aspergillus egyptiacus]